MSLLASVPWKWSQHTLKEQPLLSLSNAFFELAFNKCVFVCSCSLQYIIQCLVSGMGAIIREQGSSFISYWTLLISEALIKHGADICHGWEAYDEPFVKAQRSSTMSSHVHLSCLPLSGCLDVSFVSSSSAAPFGRKWTSDLSIKRSLFLIKQPCYQPSHSDHDVLIRVTEADWY